MIPNVVETLHFVEPLRNAFCRLGWCVDCLRAFTERSKVMKQIFGFQRSARGYTRFFCKKPDSKAKEFNCSTFLCKEAEITTYVLP